MKIPFNKPFYCNDFFKKLKLNDIKSLSGDGYYTNLIQKFFEKKYSIQNFLLTSSCTASLEMSALLLNIQKGDEIIMPSYTFSSTANAFILRGAKIRFIDSKKDDPNLDPNKIEEVITKKTKCLVIVHYAGMPCDMTEIMRICKKNNIKIVEDAAQCINSFYKGKALGTFGEIGCISFHETKNLSSGEGGGLILNKKKYSRRAKFIRDKGTNRIDLISGKVDKYGWVDLGSSYLPSDLIAQLLFHQKNYISKITFKRKKIWNFYYQNLKILDNHNFIKIPKYKDSSNINGHIFFIICKENKHSVNLKNFLIKKQISVTGHYQSLHNSSFFEDLHDGRHLKNAENLSKNLIRLPIYYSMKKIEAEYIVDNILYFFNNLDL